MSLSLTNVQQTDFDALVKAAYQSFGKRLPSTIKRRDDFVGRFVEFRKVGFVVSEPLAYQDNVTPQDPNYTKVTLTVNKFVTPTVTDVMQEVTVNFQDRKESAELIAHAVARRQDQLVIDVLNTATLPVPNIIPAGGTGMTFDKLRAVVKQFSLNNVPSGAEDRHLIMDASSEADLLSEAQFTDNDFVNKGAIKTGTLDGTVAMGMTFHVIGNMPEGGLPFQNPPTDTIRKNFAYHKSALGFGMNYFSTEINYIAEKTSWLVNGVHQSGSVVIDEVGIIQVDTVIS